MYIEQLYKKHGEDTQQVQSRYTQKLHNWSRAETQMYMEQLSNKHRENTQQVQSRYTKKYTKGRARTKKELEQLYNKHREDTQQVQSRHNPNFASRIFTTTNNETNFVYYNIQI